MVLSSVALGRYMFAYEFPLQEDDYEPLVQVVEDLLKENSGNRSQATSPSNFDSLTADHQVLPSELPQSSSNTTTSSLVTQDKDEEIDFDFCAHSADHDDDLPHLPILEIDVDTLYEQLIHSDEQFVHFIKDFQQLTSHHQRIQSSQKKIQLIFNYYHRQRIHNKFFLPQIALLLGLVSLFLGLPQNVWNSYTKLRLLPSKITILRWLSRQPRLPCLAKSQSSNFQCSVGIDNVQNILHRSHSGYPHAQMQKGIAFVEFEMTSLSLSSPQVWKDPKLTMGQVKLALTQYSNTSIKAQLMRDSMLNEDFDLGLIHDAAKQRLYVHSNFVSYNADSERDVKAVLTYFKGHFYHQPYLFVVADDKLYEIVYKLTILETDLHGPGVILIPLFDVFHWDWNKLKAIFAIYPFLNVIARQKSGEKWSIDNQENGFHVGDWTVRTVSAALWRYFDMTNNKDALEQRFQTMQSVKTSDDLFLHFLYFAGNPYTLCRIKCIRHEMNYFWELWCFWMPHWILTHKTGYASLTLMQIYVHHSLQQNIGQDMLRALMIHWNTSGKHPIPAGMAVEQARQ